MNISSLSNASAISGASRTASKPSAPMAQAPDNQSSVTGAQELAQDASALAALGSNRPTLNVFA